MSKQQIILTEDTQFSQKPDIRLLAIDLDDTMLTSVQEITPRTKAAIPGEGTGGSRHHCHWTHVYFCSALCQRAGN